MNTKYRSTGGQVSAIKNRKKAIEGYYKNPNICSECQQIIGVKDNQKVAEVRKKKFCDHKCAGNFNNRQNKKEKPIKEKIIKERIEPAIGNKTKDELFGMRKNWQSARSSIRRHASRIFFESCKEKVCIVCGYTNHIEICHIKPVSAFPGESLIKEINDIKNLVALCPNHHWEFDNGQLKL